MLRAVAGEVFGPFTLIRPLSDQGVRQRWIVRRSDEPAGRPFLLEVLPGPLAEHRALDRPLREELAYLRTFQDERFAQPARMALVRNHIGFSFFVPGTHTLQDLLAKLKQGDIAMPASAVLDLLEELTRGLIAFHERPLAKGQSRAHLALRPAHIFLIPNGRVCMSGAWVWSLERLWPWGPPRSSWPFLAPESIRGEEVDVPADVYALGRIARACLSLRPARKNGGALVLDYLYQDPPEPKLESLLDVPIFQSMIAQMLSSDPSGRHQSMRQLLEDLTLVRRQVGDRPSLSEFLYSHGFGRDELMESFGEDYDGLKTQDLSGEDLRFNTKVTTQEGEVTQGEPTLLNKATLDHFFGEEDEQDDPFASLEAALSDLEVTFADVEFQGDVKPEPLVDPYDSVSGAPSGSSPESVITQSSPRERPLRRSKRGSGKPRRAPTAMDLDLEPSITSVVVDISELLPEDSNPAGKGSQDQKPLAYLTHVQKDGSRARFSLDGKPVTIGRSPANTVHVTGDGRVSRLHCRITMEDGEFVVEDAGSNNGTLVDGVFIKRQALQGGEEIIIGGTVLQFSQS